MTFVQAITEATQPLSRVVSRRLNPECPRRAEGSTGQLPSARMGPRGARPVLWAAALLLAAAVKFGFDVAGYTHALPSAFGGRADLWWQADDGWSTWCFMAVLAAPVAWKLMQRIREEDAHASLTAPLIWLSAAVALQGVVQVLAQTVSEFIPGAHINPPAGTPLFVPFSIVDWASVVLIGLGVIYYWKRQTAAAALFGLAFVIALPGQLQGLFGLAWPIAGLGRWDLVISGVMFVWSGLFLARRVEAPALWLIASWLGLTVLVHFQTFVSDGQQSRYFVYLALLPAAYALLWAGRRLSRLAEKRPEEALGALCVMALLLVIVAVLVWIDDRFGRASSAFINGTAIFAEGGRQQIGVPLLLVTT